MSHTSPLKSLLSVGMLTISLTGCATGLSSPPIVVTQCPPMVAYDKGDQAALKAELAKLPPGSTIPEFLNDYSKLRDICRKIKKPVAMK